MIALVLESVVSTAWTLNPCRTPHRDIWIDAVSVPLMIVGVVLAKDCLLFAFVGEVFLVRAICSLMILRGSELDKPFLFSFSQINFGFKLSFFQTFKYKIAPAPLLRDICMDRSCVHTWFCVVSLPHTKKALLCRSNIDNLARFGFANSIDISFHLGY